ncbi:cytochrome c-type biogenesis protein [Primorskyibacter sp. S187A]|uniref:cytochrome c-type biogenesis protein n=1 Tax=Primorskyibacter sp. S187A TaxID=3415130 RepID=UPI003C7BD810
MRHVMLILALVFAGPAFAVEPDEVLADPVLEERAREISKNVRCVVCQNEPIDSSNAGVARDLRILIRERLVAGDTNAEVEAFLVARYGDYVLFKPPFKPSTYALWLAPVALIGFGGLAAYSAFARRKKQAVVGLSADEDAEAEALLAQFAEKDGKNDKT